VLESWFLWFLSVGCIFLHPVSRPAGSARGCAARPALASHVSHSRETIRTTFGRLRRPSRRRSSTVRSPSCKERGGGGRFQKELPLLPGRDRGEPGRRQARRDLVRRRGQGRAEEQDHTLLGQARFTTLRPKGSEDGLGLYLRRDLPGPGQGSRSGAAALHHTGHGA
jgi:hypothetical protein